MSAVLPFDIIALIIDIVGENKDKNILKELALVSHSFHQICSKHLFATVELHDANPRHRAASSKKGFVKLLKSRPDVVSYIRVLTYRMRYDNRYRLSQFSPTHPNHPSFDSDDDLLSPILPNFLRTIPLLTCLKIYGSLLDWNLLNSSLTSALLHIMHLPTINHINLSIIKNFPMSSLTSSVNLHRLQIFNLIDPPHDGEDDFYDIFHSEIMLREFLTSGYSLLTMKLLHAKMRDGRPASSLMNLRRLSVSFTLVEDEWIIQYLLQNAKLLEELHLSLGNCWSLVGLLSPSARNLKVLDLSVYLYFFPVPPLAGLCEELEAMAGRNTLEALSFEVKVDGDVTEDFIGSTVQKMEKVFVKPGWSALRQISIKISIIPRGDGEKLYEALQSLPDRYLTHLSKLDPIAFNYSASYFRY